VGSDNKQTTGEVIAAYSHYNLAKPNYRRAKRIFDLISSICMILTMPIQIFVQPSFRKYLSNSIAVLAGRKTWIGYAYQQSTLPILSPGILTPNGMKIGSTEASQQMLMEAVDQRYAADYEWTMDMAILQKSIRKIGSNY
jgi:lipopolysaccharide/colanic/teichoic acid biosynthesis glycosyltransferase